MANKAFDLFGGRRAWVQVARGEAIVNGLALAAGDGLSVTDTRKIEMAGTAAGAELLVFDMAA